MRYSKSDSEYFRNKKGGGLEKNGKLNKNNFTNKNYVVPNQNISFELETMNNINKNNKQTSSIEKRNLRNNDSIKKIKIMRNKGFLGFNEPYIFFGYNPETRKYKYVCYNTPTFALSIVSDPIICMKLHDNKIVKLTHEEFTKIDIEELIVLCYEFLKIRQKNHGFMDTLFRYLSMFVFEKVINTKFHNSNNHNSNHHKMYRHMVEESIYLEFQHSMLLPQQYHKMESR